MGEWAACYLLRSIQRAVFTTRCSDPRLSVSLLVLQACQTPSQPGHAKVVRCRAARGNERLASSIKRRSDHFHAIGHEAVGCTSFRVPVQEAAVAATELAGPGLESDNPHGCSRGPPTEAICWLAARLPCPLMRLRACKADDRAVSRRRHQVRPGMRCGCWLQGTPSPTPGHSPRPCCLTACPAQT